jgi:hypothetical protein
LEGWRGLTLSWQLAFEWVRNISGRHHETSISAVNLVLCLIGPVAAGPFDDAVGIFRPVAGQRHAHVDCHSSASAVWAAHRASHATWRLRLNGHEREKCWFAAGKSTLTRADTSRDANHEITSMIPIRVPLPRSQNTRPPPNAASPQLQIWGSPMRIDPRWEEIFMRRERGAE